jgi:hypothetical protein
MAGGEVSCAVWILERSVIRPPNGEGVHDLYALANQNWNKMPAATADGGRRTEAGLKLGDRHAQGML